MTVIRSAFPFDWRQIAAVAAGERLELSDEARGRIAAARPPYTDSLWRGVRSVVPTWRNDRPLAEDMALAFRMIADSAPPPPPNPGKMMRPAVTNAGRGAGPASAAGTNPAAPTTPGVAACDLQSAA